MAALSSDLLTPIVEVYEGTPTTTSQDVADYFGKSHKDVLKGIRSLLRDLGSELERKIAPQPDSWSASEALQLSELETKSGQPLDPPNPNFSLSYIEVAGPNNSVRKQPVYRMTRDGFVLLAMGFTGKQALKFKLAYIEAFNKMEEALKRRPDGLSLDEALRSGRFLVRFEGNGHFSMREVGKYVTCLNTDDERQMMELIEQLVPLSLVPKMLQAGIDRLSRHKGVKKLGGSQ